MDEYRSVEAEKSVFLSGKEKERERGSEQSQVVSDLHSGEVHPALRKKSRTVSLFLSAASA